MQPVKYRFGRGSLCNSVSGLGHFGMSSPEDNGSLFDFQSNRQTNSVVIENIPDNVNRREVVSLFSNLVGEVRSFQDVRAPSTHLEITFVDRDSAAKALCMNGYTVGGFPISVTATSSPLNQVVNQAKDDRRNLYVLGLPFALSKNEFGNIFAQYGTVSHCVILATVDNSSRRRGFVVMSSHEEALQAMAALTRTQIKGHVIDVSWAVVQRSQGFLDGGDRALLLESRSQLPCPSPKPSDRHRLASSDSSDSSLESHDAAPVSLTPVLMPTSSLLVTNLPTLLFSQAHDLHPLFFPFGTIEKLEIVHVSPLGTMSVLVQYSRASVAQEAKESLAGQLYGSYRIEAQYVKPQNSSRSYSDENTPPPGVPVEVTQNFPRNYFGQHRDPLAPIGQPCDPTVAPRDAMSLKFFGSWQGDLPFHDFVNHFQPRQYPLSVINPSFSNDYNDFDEPYFTSAGSRLGFNQKYNYGPPFNYRPQNTFSKPTNLHTLYQSSTA